MFVALLADSVTAQGFGSILISMSSLFAGILIPPQNISQIWIWAYWVFPLHYVLEGLVASQFHDDTTQIEASAGSPYNEYLLSTDQCMPCEGDVSSSTSCCGTAANWVDYKFGGLWQYDNIKWNALYLICVIVLAKLIKLWGLWKFNYLAK
jgi:ABC-type multidrug transport system permease subunit